MKLTGFLKNAEHIYIIHDVPIQRGSFRHADIVLDEKLDKTQGHLTTPIPSLPTKRTPRSSGGPDKTSEDPAEKPLKKPPKTQLEKPLEPGFRMAIEKRS